MKQKILLGLLPIALYWAVLCGFAFWWAQYCGTPAAGDFGFLTYLPYFFGGAALSGLALGYLTGWVSHAARLWPLALYLPALLLAVYFSLWLSEAFLVCHPRLWLFWQELDRWWKIWNMVDAKPLLAENAIGFTLGYLLRLRRARKRAG